MRTSTWIVLLAGLLAGALPGCDASVPEAVHTVEVVNPSAGSGEATHRAEDPHAAKRRTIGYAPVEPQPFEAPERKPELDMYPCSDCHEDETPNLEERQLEDEHDDLLLDHGEGRFWCGECHDFYSRDNLISMKGQPISFDEAWLLCGQCHFVQQRDWYMGAHGKRVESWRGPRTIYSCTECHDPHSPSIKPFEPDPPPLVRRGLDRQVVPHAASRLSLWDRISQRMESR